jgi:hypothetical protein
MEGLWPQLEHRMASPHHGHAAAASAAVAPVLPDSRPTR